MGGRCQSHRGDAVLHPLQGERQTRPSPAKVSEGSSRRGLHPSNHIQTQSILAAPFFTLYTETYAQPEGRVCRVNLF